MTLTHKQFSAWMLEQQYAAGMISREELCRACPKCEECKQPHRIRDAHNKPIGTLHKAKGILR